MEKERRAMVSIEEIKSIVAESVKQTLIQLGLDTSDPIQIQKDMAFARDLRKNTEAIKRGGFITICGTIIAGMLGLIWTALKSVH
jgi:hypothetical protein